MRFAPTDEHEAIAEAIDDIAAGSDVVAAARSWAAGDHAPGTVLLATLAEFGLLGLRIGEEDGGIGADAGFLTAAVERLGFHGMPGPVIETVAFAPLLAPPQRSGVAAGVTLVTASVAGLEPRAVDADVAAIAIAIDGGTARLASAGDPAASVAGMRRLFTLVADGEPLAASAASVEKAVDEAVLSSAAWLIGAGERLLAESVAYAQVRSQFGRTIGEYQAVKHQLADVRIALTFARPLVQRAALTLDSDDRPRDVSAAKVAASDAALRAARTALQVHGAIGYTDEHALGLWITTVRALVGAWGTPAVHRDRIASAILAS